MRVAIPVAAGRLCQHFGHCGQFVLIEVDPAARTLGEKTEMEAPEHQPGLLPRWLADLGVDVVIAGGMGSRARALFSQNGITVMTGAPAEKPENLVAAYLAGTLRTGQNVCDH